MHPDVVILAVGQFKVELRMREKENLSELQDWQTKCCYSRAGFPREPAELRECLAQGKWGAFSLVLFCYLSPKGNTLHLFFLKIHIFSTLVNSFLVS